MARLILSISCVGLIVFGSGNVSDQPAYKPDGRIILALDRSASGYRIASATILPGADALPLEAGNTSVSISDATGSVLYSGSLRMPEYIYHDKADDNGDLSGFRTLVQEPVVVALPYYNSADTIEFRDEDHRVLLRQKLKEIPLRSPSAIHAQFPATSQPPDFRGYLRTLGSEEPPTPGSMHAADEKQIPHPSANVNGKVVVNGLPQGGQIWASISFYNNDDGTFATSTTVGWGYEPTFSVSLDSGKYFAKIWCYYWDPDVGNGGDSVALYPFPQTVTDINVGGSAPTSDIVFTLNLNRLVKGKVKVQGGGAVGAGVYIFDTKLTGSLFQTNAISLTTDQNGEFAVRLPARKYPVVVVPWLQDEAGEMLSIEKVKPKGITNLTLNCPRTTKASGKALKQIWPSPGSSPEPPAKGKLNILFLAEAYTNGNEKFKDKNKNGVWDGDLFLDDNTNGKWDAGEYYYDRNRNNAYDKPEKFTDKNKDGICNRYERAKFEMDCAVAASSLLNFRPFDKQSKRINIYTYWVASKHGVQKFSQYNMWKNMNTQFGVSCNSTGGFQIGQVNSQTVYNFAASVMPNYTVPVVMVHDPLNALRANAAFNFGRVLMSAEDHRGGTVLIHEFGHSIGNLGDEYVYTSGSTYSGGEPAEANLTIETDPDKVKWRKYIKGSPPVPTPLGYDGYGIFEGGAYGQFGLYRPTSTSMMRSTSYPFFKVNEARMKSVLKQFKK